MKWKTRFALLAVLLAVLIAAFADTAAAKPEWIGVKIKSWSIRKVGDNAGKPGYYSLHLEVTHTNNSDDRVVTNIYDKTGKMTLKKGCVIAGKKTTAFSVVNLKSTKNNKVDLTPGESVTLTYNLPITNSDNGLKGVNWTWSEANKLLGSGGWKLTYSYDCQVKSRKE
jgi:hypothetical protein